MYMKKPIFYIWWFQILLPHKVATLGHVFPPPKRGFGVLLVSFDSSLWGFPHLYQPHSHCFYTNVLTVLFGFCSVYLRPSLQACLDVRNQQGLFFFFVCLIFTSQVLALTFLLCCMVYVIACRLPYNIWSSFPHFSHRFSSLLPRFWWFISWTVCDKSAARHGKTSFPFWDLEWR
jgi:hypothetical protein